MAIRLRKDGNTIYASSSGLLIESEKRQADKLDRELGLSIVNLEKQLIEEGAVTKDGKKKDALKVWYKFGKLLNRLGAKYKVIGSSYEKFYWRAVYDHVSPRIQKGQFPKKSERWKTNHFRICGLMARRPWKEVKKLGPWSVWKDIFDNKKVLEDPRVEDWVVKTISDLRKRGWGHKNIRVFLYAVSRRIRDIETTILTKRELYKKLQEIEPEEVGGR